MRPTPLQGREVIGEVTAQLRAWAAGSASAREHLFELVYPDLRHLARRHLARESSEISIQATELVHEAYLKLVDQRRCDWQSRAHFFAVSATLIRRILVDHAKHRLRSKRGLGAVHLSIDEVLLPGRESNLDLLALDQALIELAGVRVTTARIVELRYFTGLSLDDTAQVVGLSRTTVQRRWRFAKSWLAGKLAGRR